MALKKYQNIITAVVALCLLTGLVLTPGLAREASADSITPVSCQFLGIVRDDGIVVPAGYKVIAKVDGVEKASSTTNAEGKYGYDTPLVITGYEGKTIQFWINGILADQGGIIQEGGMTFLNLSIKSGNPPAPPTTTVGSKPAPGTYPPTSFRGTVRNDGTPVPAGYTVVARVRGMEYASSKTNAEGKYGIDSAFKVEAQDGDVISFYINGSRADQTYAAEGGTLAQLDLSYKEAAITTPAPATTPPADPAGSSQPVASPKPAEAAAPDNSESGSTAQPVIIGFIALMAVLCLGLVYAIMKRRQPQWQSQSQYEAQSDTQAQAMQTELQSRLQYRQRQTPQPKSTDIAIRKPREPGQRQ